MVINAYKTIFAEKKTVDKQERKEIINSITKKLLETELEIIEKENREKIRKKIENILIEKYEISEEMIIEKIVNEIMDKLFGYGMLEKYLKDGITSDIRVVAFDSVYIKQRGVWKKTADSFVTKEEFDDYIRFCALKNNYNINNESPIGIFSDRKNGLRIEAGVEPVNVASSNLVIRIHKNENPKNLEELFLDKQMLNKNSYKIIKKSIDTFSNILICGKGGSGKTTLLRAIINALPENISINTNEETAELYIEGRNVIQRECLTTRAEDKNVDLEKLSKHSLVMSNDVIVIGELKGKEANSFFDAISTGHMGLATVHSDTTKNAIDRVITLIKKDIKATQYTEKFLRRFLADTIDYIVLVDGFEVKSIDKVRYDEASEQIKITNLYKKVKQ